MFSVFSLAAQCSSLTVNLVVTLRKFISLLLSVVYFDNDFTAFHWLGTLLVFTGTLLFTDVFSSCCSFLSANEVAGSASAASYRADRDECFDEQIASKEPTTTIACSPADNIVRQRAIGHKVTGKDFLEVNKFSYHVISTGDDVSDSVLSPQQAAITDSKPDDSLEKVTPRLAGDAVTGTVLTCGVFLDACRDSGVGDKHFKSS